MSISTLRRSEPRTVLLWGDRWWLPHHKVPVPFGEIGQAVDLLAQAWPFEERTIRLVYQPEEFQSVATECPYGKRATLAMALGEQFPALAHPGHVWGFEPILPQGETFRTVVHFETRPSLFGIVQRLQEKGFAVLNAWPMATWLNALPPEVSESGAMSVVALTADRYCVYRHSAAGERSAHAGAGEGMMSTLLPQLRTDQPELRGLEFILYVTTDERLVEEVNNRLPVSETQIAGVLLLWDALAKPAFLAMHHPAQLLPPIPRIPSRAATAIATSVLLFISVALAVDAMRILREPCTDVAAPPVEVTVPVTQLADFLDALGRAAAPDLVITRVRIRGAEIEVIGAVSPQVGATAIERWAAAVSKPFRISAVAAEDGTFRATGTLGSS